MADIKTAAKHPNKLPFIGVLTIVDEPSDKAPAGTRGHRVLLTKKAAVDALPTLIGMGVNYASGNAHDQTFKHGVIEAAELVGNEIQVSGYLFVRDCPKVVSSINAKAEEFGMSYEVANCFCPDMRSDVLRLERVTFTGAAIVLREKAAYRRTQFFLVD